MFKMDTVEALNGQSKLNSKVTNDHVGLPSISRQDQAKQRLMIQKNKTLTVRVPPPGHEYDFRRTPDLDRATPKKYMNGQIRPCIPPDTPVDFERLNLNESPTLLRHRHRERLEIGRCPTPMPIESDFHKRTEPSAPLPTARSAWDRTNVADVDDLEDMEGNVDLRTPRYQMFKVRDRVGRKFKPANLKSNCDLKMYDVEAEPSENMPMPEPPVNLTETVLQQYYHKPVNRDRRIAKWLVDCKEKSCNLLPTHLPDINSANKLNGALSFEDI